MSKGIIRSERSSPLGANSNTTLKLFSPCRKGSARNEASCDLIQKEVEHVVHAKIKREDAHFRIMMNALLYARTHAS